MVTNEAMHIALKKMSRKYGVSINHLMIRLTKKEDAEILYKFWGEEIKSPRGNTVLNFFKPHSLDYCLNTKDKRNKHLCIYYTSYNGATDEKLFTAQEFCAEISKYIIGNSIFKIT